MPQLLLKKKVFDKIPINQKLQFHKFNSFLSIKPNMQKMFLHILGKAVEKHIFQGISQGFSPTYHCWNMLEIWKNGYWLELWCDIHNFFLTYPGITLRSIPLSVVCDIFGVNSKTKMHCQKTFSKKKSINFLLQTHNKFLRWKL